LVIDDEQFVREALERVLKGPDTTVASCPDAHSALSLLKEQPVDLAIVDAVLPGMDGATVIRHIRQDFPRTRIIAISGGGSFGLEAYRPEAIATGAYLAACRSAGAEATLAKPFETRELRALIDQLLAESGG
jgi:CheY-like chemotaxis protein